VAVTDFLKAAVRHSGWSKKMRKQIKGIAEPYNSGSVTLDPLKPDE
jgi:hypothetical protein